MRGNVTDNAMNPGVGDIIQVTTPRCISNFYPQLAGIRMFKLILFHQTLEQFTAETVLSDSESIATFLIARSQIIDGPFKILNCDKIKMSS